MWCVIVPLKQYDDDDDDDDDYNPVCRGRVLDVDETHQS